MGSKRPSKYSLIHFYKRFKTKFIRRPVMDPRMQAFIQQEQEKAKLQNVIHEINEKCWDTCFDGKPGNKIDGRTENCLNNCVDRFIDTNLLLVQRFERKVTDMAAQAGLTEGM